MDWVKIENKIEGYPQLAPEGYAQENPTEALETAANGGAVYDMDKMVHLHGLLGYAVSYAMYHDIADAFDSAGTDVLDLTEKQAPLIEAVIRANATMTELKPEELLGLLLESGECVYEYALEGEYWTRNAIGPEGSDDIGGMLELTLHRLVDAGYEDRVHEVMGAVKEDEIPVEEGITFIDLGYALPGAIFHWEKQKAAA